MKKYYKYFAIVTAVLLYNCEATESTTLEDFVGFEIGPLSQAVPENTTSTKEVNIYASEASSTDRTYSLEVDVDPKVTTLKAKYTVPATVTIPANSKVGTFSVSVTDDETLGFVDQALVINFQGEAGRNFSTPLTVNFAEECLETLVKLSITTDNWPEETSWELYDLSGAEPTLLEAGGPYPGAANREKTLAIRFCLTPGDYGIALYDVYGDGGPSFNVTSGNTTYVDDIETTTAETTARFTIE